MARPAFKATDENRRQVTLMVGVGIQQELIAKVLNCDIKTLRKHFKKELEVGKATVITKVAAQLMRNIEKGKEASAIFFLKTQAGWREKEPTTDDKDKKEINNIVMQFASIPEKPTDHNK
jgi:hypothetical protein